MFAECVREFNVHVNVSDMEVTLQLCKLFLLIKFVEG